MNRSRNQVNAYYNRDVSLHKPGVIPNSSRRISPITLNGHKYELKHKLCPKNTIESWFENHSPHERQAVYSFLDTLYRADRSNENNQQHQKTLNRRDSFNRINTCKSYSLGRRLSQNSRRNSQPLKSDHGDVLQSLKKLRVSSSVQEKGIQTSPSALNTCLPDANGTRNYSKSETNCVRSTTSIVEHPEKFKAENSTVNTSGIDDKASRRYLSQTWRVINPREDVTLNIRPDNNISSFFQYTHKTYPEYFFIHPDWY